VDRSGPLPRDAPVVVLLLCLKIYALAYWVREILIVALMHIHIGSKLVSDVRPDSELTQELTD